MYRSQGQDRAGQDAEPHDASPPTSDETGPVSASDEGGNPFTLVRGWQSEAAPLREPRCMPTGSLVLEPPALLPLHYLCVPLLV